jgi:hypothetical protein
MKRLLAWLRGFWAWLWELNLVWMGVALPIVVLALAAVSFSERSVRLSGMVIELAGACLVIVEILDARRRFGAPSVGQWLVSWFRRFPRIRPVTISVQGAVHLHLGGNARAHFWYGVGDQPTDTARLEALEKNVVRLRDLVYQLETDLEEARRQLSSSLKSEVSVLREFTSGLNSKVADAQTGGHMLAAVGLLWIVIGMVCSTASDIVVAWFA